MLFGKDKAYCMPGRVFFYETLL